MERSILVELRWRLGDEIMALPIVEALRRQNTTWRIGVWSNYPELFAQNPSIDSVNDISFSPDRYILLRGAPRDVYRLDHYASRARVPTPDTRPTLRLDDWTTPLLDEVPREEGDLVAVAPGASWPTKRWPDEQWREVCRGLHARGYHVVELGRDGEALGAGLNLVGRTTVREAAAVLKRVKLLLCSDSGLMHLSLAVGTPVVALFGPTEPSILVRDEPKFHPVPIERECRGCWNVSQTMKEPGICPLGIEPCMDAIPIETVWAEIEAVMSPGR